MSRKTFLTVASIIAICVGIFALSMPAALLESKGVAGNAGTNVWVRETGLLLISIGIMVFLVRGHANSPTLRAFLAGNAILQIGLLPIEIAAYAQGVITEAPGIMPNSILHVLLAGGFAYYAAGCNASAQT